MFILLGILLVAIGLTAIALQRFYSSIPVRELRRLAKRGDHLAQVLYRPVAFGASLRTLLWLVACLALAGGLLLLIPGPPQFVAFLVTAGILALALVWMPSARLTIHTAHFAAAAAPLLASVLQRVHPVLDSLARAINRSRTIDAHSRLYEKEDLTALLHAQKEQSDNRISLEELELTHRALTFADKQAADIVQPLAKTHLVNAEDSIGPILLDRLHKSGQSSFLVYKGKKSELVGSLLMRDAVNARTGGKVASLVRGDMCYVHEAFTLPQVLAALQKTKQHTAVVVNAFAETVGLVSQEAVLVELTGPLPSEEHAYESRASMAGYKPAKSANDSDDPVPDTREDDADISDPKTAAPSPGPTEVVK